MHAHVHRILVDSSKRAYGVLLQRKDKMYAIVARKEVILSAGAIGSPQILMLSGIGPASHLQSLGNHQVFHLISTLPAYAGRDQEREHTKIHVFYVNFSFYAF